MCTRPIHDTNTAAAARKQQVRCRPLPRRRATRLEAKSDRLTQRSATRRSQSPAAAAAAANCPLAPVQVHPVGRSVGRPAAKDVRLLPPPRRGGRREPPPVLLAPAAANKSFLAEGEFHLRTRRRVCWSRLSSHGDDGAGHLAPPYRLAEMLLPQKEVVVLSTPPPPPPLPSLLPIYFSFKPFASTCRRPAQHFDEWQAEFAAATFRDCSSQRPAAPNQSA